MRKVYRRIKMEDFELEEQKAIEEEQQKNYFQSEDRVPESEKPQIKYGEYEKCEFFLLYDRVEPEDSSSPYALKQFNFLHSHPLSYAATFPPRPAFGVRIKTQV